MAYYFKIIPFTPCFLEHSISTFISHECVGRIGKSITRIIANFIRQNSDLVRQFFPIHSSYPQKIPFIFCISFDFGSQGLILT